MFKKFGRDELSQLKQLKASQAKHVKQMIQQQYPGLPLEIVLPKEYPLFQTTLKTDKSTTIILANNKIYFIQQGEIFMPTLLLASTYPEMMKQVQVDKGAFKHVLGGSNIMAPGLTSAGGKLPDGIEANEYVLIMGEEKQHPLGIGIMKMKSEEIREKNSGIAIDLIQFCGDGLWLDCLDH